MRIVMGVDGGGSKTYTVIVNELGVKLGAGLSGSGNYEVVGVPQAIENIQFSIKSALQQAGLEYDDIDFVQYGLAGADRPQDFVMLRKALSSIPCKSWDLVGDVMEGLRIGSSTYTGVVLICGSGTNAAGRNQKGDFLQVGGLGELFGDRAGGSYIATTAFSLACRSAAGQEIPSLLTEIIPQYYNFSTMFEVRDYFLDNGIEEVSGEITLLLHQAADLGDLLSIQCLMEIGKELGNSANAVLRRLGGFERIAPTVVLIGSVLQKGKNPYLLQAIQTTIKHQFGEAQIIIPEMAPVYGAVMLAMDALNIKIEPHFEKQFIQYGGYE